jgi:spectinomycin phosphotransferase
MDAGACNAMLEKPDLPDEELISCLKRAYGLTVAQLDFLPLGADQNTAVYRAVSARGKRYFAKLRRGDFDPASVAVPRYLCDLAIEQIIPALPTRAEELWADLAPFKVILYPFVAGQNGFEVVLTDRQRIEFGGALKKVHSARIPAGLTAGVPRESFSPRWRGKVRTFLAQIETRSIADPVASEAAAFLKAKRQKTLELVERAARLAAPLQNKPPSFVLCHGDIHAWNLLITPEKKLYMVDWDTLVFAPKERDLMFVGAGLGGRGHSLQEEQALFYQGYGPTRVNPVALAYYRYERIVEDIAVYCEQIFLSADGGEDRRQALDHLRSNFRPGGTIEIANRTDKTRA